MLHRLPFKVERVTSEQTGNPASTLQTYDPRGVGWISGRFCEWPQILCVRLNAGKCVAKQIQLLSHQHCIARVIEIFTAFSGDDVSTAQFERVGNVRLRTNQTTKYTGRELAKIDLPNIQCELLLLRLHGCHLNPLNLFNQAGIVALNVLGEPCVAPNPLDILAVTQQQQQRKQPQKQSRTRAPQFSARLESELQLNMERETGSRIDLNKFDYVVMPEHERLALKLRRPMTTDDLSFDLTYDRWTSLMIKRTEKAKRFFAVELEDFEKAIELQQLGEMLKQEGQAVGAIDAKRIGAIQKSDFARARRLHAETNELRQAIQAKVSACPAMKAYRVAHGLDPMGDKLEDFSVDESVAEERRKAAIAIQSRFRARRGKARFQAKRKEKMLDAEEQRRREAAASKIQSMYRGRNGRMEFLAKRAAARPKPYAEAQKDPRKDGSFDFEVSYAEGELGVTFNETLDAKGDFRCCCETIVSESQSEVAGMQSGDLLIEVGGMSLKGKGYAEVMLMMKEAARTRPFKVCVRRLSDAERAAATTTATMTTANDSDGEDSTLSVVSVNTKRSRKLAKSREKLLRKLGPADKAKGEFDCSFDDGPIGMSLEEDKERDEGELVAVVTSIEEGGQAEREGVQLFDYCKAIGGVDVSSMAFASILKTLKKNMILAPVPIRFVRLSADDDDDDDEDGGGGDGDNDDDLL
eukprot:g3097.t1